MDPNLPKGNLHLQKKLSKLTVFIILAVIASLGASAYILFFTGPTIPKLTKLFEPKAPTVSVETKVENPFDKETQFVNPFDPVKSPFYALKDAEVDK